jgi:molybdopterin converting factor subunit 1
MRVRVMYFAAVRDVTGVDDESLELPDGTRTVGDFAVHLVARYPALEPYLSALRFAQNEEFASPAAVLADGDVLAVIPPVAGG